jgi:C4-dicarboxylate-specific signal transduction histidine kinase
LVRRTGVLHHAAGAVHGVGRMAQRQLGLELAALKAVRPVGCALQVAALVAVRLRGVERERAGRAIALRLGVEVANLVDNAVRYAGEGATVQLTLAPVGAGGWQLVVQDDGPGIPVAEQARVFERFYRGAGHAEPGSGLGLAIVQQAAQRLGAQVHITPGLHGQGVGFSLRTDPGLR